jgi:hypothetical protein
MRQIVYAERLYGPAASDEAYKPNDQEDKKEDPGDTGRRSGNSGETKKTRDQCNNEKDERPVQHMVLLPIEVANVRLQFYNQGTRLPLAAKVHKLRYANAGRDPHRFGMRVGISLRPPGTGPPQGFSRLSSG